MVIKLVIYQSNVKQLPIESWYHVQKVHTTTKFDQSEKVSKYDFSWTWYEPWDVDRPNDCSLFQSCSLADHMCANCYTGKNCQDPQGKNGSK